MAEQYSPMVITASVLRSSQQAGEPFQLVTDEIKDNQVQIDWFSKLSLCSLIQSVEILDSCQ